MARLMLVLGLVLSLAACGGSGTDGLSTAEEEDLQAQVTAAVAARDAAEAAKRMAEAAKDAAEADKRIAEADKDAAEAAKDAAEAAKDVAEAAKDAAEAAKRIAEADKVAAEADKRIAEAAKDAAEADKRIAEAAKDAAETAKDAAETAKDAAETAKRIAEADKVAAEADKRIAEAAKDAAETAKDTAETAKDAAETAERIAEADKRRAEAAKDTAEAEVVRLRAALREAQRLAGIAQNAQNRLTEQAEEARKQALQAEAGVALTGLGGTALEGQMVGPKYRAPASVSAPNVTFISPRGSSAGKWYATTASNQGQISDDTIVVYSDVGAPTRTPIMEVYGAFDEDADSTSLLAITVANEHNNLITSSHFPSPGRTATIPLTIDSTDDDVDDDDMTAKLRGSFDGASGTFQCSGGACTVRNTGGGYVLDGTWTFRTSKSSRVSVPDGEFMHFGWWRKKTNQRWRIYLRHVQRRRNSQCPAVASPRFRGRRPMKALRLGNTPSISLSALSRTTAHSRPRPGLRRTSTRRCSPGASPGSTCHPVGP